MAKAQTDIRTTSYDVNQANAFGYVGTIEDALTQIRAETQFPVTNRARAELLHFLGADKSVTELSGFQLKPIHMPAVYVFPMNEDEDWSVHYGEPDAPKQPWDAFSPYSLEYAMARWPQNFRLQE
jgi:hypothetical protein